MNDMPTDARPTREDVIAGFRWILGREPESEEVIAQHARLSNVASLRDTLLNSKEFALANKSLRFDQKWVLASVYGGQFRMWLDLHDQYVSYGCLIDDYEPIETGFIRANARAGATAIDIGANIGWHTLGLARAVGPEGRVIAFEPRQPTRDYLASTVVQNGLIDRVKLFPCGLWDEDAELALGWEHDTTNPGHSFITRDQSGYALQKVQLKRLDDVASGPVDFIKIDVEGAEPRVIAGGRKLISACRPIILAELYPQQLNDVSGVSVRRFIAQMSELGYECRLLESGHTGREINDFPADVGRELVNVVFVERGRQLSWPG